jgi:hypothetical protein
MAMKLQAGGVLGKRNFPPVWAVGSTRVDLVSFSVYEQSLFGSRDQQEEGVSHGSVAGCVKLPSLSWYETGFELTSSREMLKQR